MARYTSFTVLQERWLVSEWFDRVRCWLGSVVCRVVGHSDRVQGDWPADLVCPRCGDLEMDFVLSITVVRGSQKDGGA